MAVKSPALTKNQELVLGALSQAGSALSAYNILDTLRDDGLRAPLQVYRALDKLMEHGLVHRIESLNSFVACAHPDCHNATLIAFAICDGCGSISEFSSEELQTHLGAWCTNNRFQPTATTLEIRGKCGACRAN
jgi:Fur family zinc uptake transcriptional regulator